MTKVLSISILMIFFISCDFFHKRRCEWYLEPDPKNRHLVEEGWVIACARNYNINRQKCHIKLKYEKAEELYGKTFRFVDLELDNEKFPREFKSVETCTP